MGQTIGTVKPPNGIYAVAVVFFFFGMICAMQAVGLAFWALGVRGVNLGNLRWTLPASLVAFFAVLCGVYFLTRMHPAPRWLLFAMTLLLGVQFALPPPGDSPFYSPRQLYLNRAILMLPLVASCIYLLTPRFRDAARAFRASPPNR